jgi:exodeoxyribonuclease VII small subunit
MTEKKPATSAARGKRNPPASTVAPSPSYEAAREELIEVVRRLEAGGTTLEESLALWERGEELATICQDWLDGAMERLDKVAGPTPEPTG